MYAYSFGMYSLDTFIDAYFNMQVLKMYFGVKITTEKYKWTSLSYSEKDIEKKPENVLRFSVTLR